MVKEIKYTNIRRVLDDLMDHPMLVNLTIEQVVRYTIRFMALYSYPKFYTNKIATVSIEKFRGVLPCDLISIIQVKDCKTGICLRSMTDTFLPEDREDRGRRYNTELSFKTQGNIIYTSFSEGEVEISYRSVSVDEDGFPLIIDNETYLNALEAYIKKQIFTIKFDQQKIPAGVLQNAQRDYAIAAANLETEFTTPSYSEAEAMSRFHLSLIPRIREFERGFRNLGDAQIIKRH